MQNLLSQLRKKTSDAHQDLEELLYSNELKSGTISKEQYAHLLLIQYLFFNELEVRIKETDFLTEYLLPRASFAKKDLESLGIRIDENQNPFHLKHLTKEEQLGYLYVALGSSLGGQMIVKMLEKQESIPNEALSFYGNSKQNIPLWKKFKKEILEPENSYNTSLVTEAAYSAFLSFRDLYHQTQAYYEKSTSD